MVRLDVQLLVFLFERRLDLLDYLVSDVVDMGTAFGGANAVDKGHLLELAIAQTGNDLPPLVFLLDDLWQVFGFLCV